MNQQDFRQSDEWGQQRSDFLYHHLHVAAKKLDLELVGELTFTGEMRSVGVHSRDNTGDVWLRVAMDDPDARQICRWDGNIEANAIKGVPKPEIYRWADWFDPDWEEPAWDEKGIRLRAEVGTYVPDKPVSRDGDIFDDPQLPESWWNALRPALDAIQRHPAPKDFFGWYPEDTADCVERFFDTKLPAEMYTTQVTWTTAHGDLHWVNITGPRLWLLDWETWRRAPAWCDAATMYCNSLFHPPTAQRIYDLFPELDSHSGMIAQLSVVGRYLWMIDDEKATAPLRALGEKLVHRLRSTL